MSRQMYRLLSLCLALALLAPFLLTGPQAALADNPNPAVEIIEAPPLEDGATLSRPGQSGRVNVAIHLDGEPVVKTYIAGKAAGMGKDDLAKAQKARKGELESAQKALVPAIKAKAPSARLMSQHQTLVNAVIVRVNRSEIAALRRLPGVKAVSEVPDAKLDLSESVPYIGAQRVATELGITGRGTRVAIIDSGIDYTHANYGGPGTVAAYEVATGSPTTITETVTITNPVTGAVVTTTMFPTEKIIGGYDFVGSNWPETEDSVLEPDPDPIDDGPGAGHGSHVSGITAGFGVPNASFNGSIPADDTFAGTTIFHGVAPAAQIYAFKVCSSISTSCASVAMIQGLEAAADLNGDGDMSDHVDALNMSIGGPFGASTTTEAANNAVLAGIAYANSAGNSGDVPYIGGAPAVAERVVSVANGYATNQFAYTLDGVAPAAIAGRKFLMTPQAWAPAITTPINGEVVFIGRACPGDELAANPAGKIALAIRGTCAVSLKAATASAAGATAAIVYNNAAGSLPPDFSYGGGDVTVPTVTLNNADGTLLRNTPGAQITLSLSGGIPITGYLSSGSSRGPSIVSNGLKPDVTAPGTNIVSTGAGEGAEGETLSGTSMASPHVAGVMALVKEANPTWNAQEVSAAIVNTARPDVKTLLGLNADNTPQSGVVSTSLQGAGMVDAYKATTTKTLAWVPNEVASLSFGFHAVNGTKSVTKQLVVSNKGTAARTYNLSFEPAGSFPTGTTVTFSPASVTVLAGSTASVNVTLNISAAGLRPYALGGSSATSPTALTNAEISGFVKVVEQGGMNETVSAPLYAIARPASDVTPASTNIELSRFGEDEAITARLTNRSATPGAVEVFSLAGSDPNEADVDDIYDIQHVGVRSITATIGGQPRQLIQFSVKSYGRQTLAMQTWYEFSIDSNRDGRADYYVWNQDQALPSSLNGVNIVVVQNAATGAAAAQYATIYYANGSNTILTVNASALGLGAANQSFDFVVASADPIFTGEYLDFAPDGENDAYTFNAAQGRFRHNDADGSLTVPANGSLEVQVWPNAAGWVGGDRPNRIGEQGFLIHYLDNETAANEAAAVTFTFPFRFTVEQKTFTFDPEHSGYVVNRLGNEVFFRDNLWVGVDNRSLRPLYFLGVAHFNLGSAGSMVEFDDVAFEVTGLDATYVDPRLDSKWRAELLDASVDSMLHRATYGLIANARAVAMLTPELTDAALGVGAINSFSLNAAGRAALEANVRSSGSATIRLSAQPQYHVGMHLFGWDGRATATAKPPVMKALVINKMR